MMLRGAFLLALIPGSRACFSTFSNHVSDDISGATTSSCFNFGVSTATNEFVICTTSCTSANSVTVQATVDGDNIGCRRREERNLRQLQTESTITDSDSAGCSTELKFGSTVASSSLAVHIMATNHVDLKITCECRSEGSSGGAPTPFPTPPPPIGSGGNVCFSDTTAVQVQDKGEVLMKNLKIGDKVLTGSNQYQPIYSFGHRHEDLEANFLQIHFKGGSKPLEMTGNHMVLAANGQAIPAVQLKVGDRVLRYSFVSRTNSEPVEVTKITKIEKKGLYMPLTPGGLLIADDLLASAYVSIEEDAPGFVNILKYIPFMNEQNLVHWWLSPFRMLCIRVSSEFCSKDTNTNEEGILYWLLVGRDLARFVDQLMNLFGRLLPAILVILTVALAARRSYYKMEDVKNGVHF